MLLAQEENWPCHACASTVGEDKKPWTIRLELWAIRMKDIKKEVEYEKHKLNHSGVLRTPKDE